MIEIAVPGLGVIGLEHLVLDVNGTLAVDGVLLAGVEERLLKLREQLQVHLITADTHGGQSVIDGTLNLVAVRLRGDMPEAEQKAEFVRGLSAEGVVAVGNGANDVLMLRQARLGIAVLGDEGLAGGASNAADVLVPHINSALDLLLHPRRLIATLRR